MPETAPNSMTVLSPRYYCPVPVNVTYSGLVMLPLLSLRTTLPVRAPVAVGVKVTVTVQVCPGSIGLGQLLVWAKSPVAAMLAKVSFCVPTFPTVKVCEALVVPTA